jgi:hypothetical protein
MASPYVWRRRIGAATAVAAVLVALGACGKSNPPAGGNNNPSGAGQIGDAGNASGTPTAAATTQGTGGGGNGGGGGGATTSPYPSDAKSYGLEILKAIANKDNVRLKALTDTNTVNYVLQQLYQNKNGQWTYISCTNGTTTSCHYYNQTGDTAQVGMTTSQLGNPGAGNSVYIQGDNFPTDPSGYVLAFVSSWMGGNYDRMVALSSTSVAGYAQGQTTPKVGKVGSAYSCGSGKTCVDAGSDIAGGVAYPPYFHFVIDTAKISAGKPNGITGYLPADNTNFHN